MNDMGKLKNQTVSITFRFFAQDQKVEVNLEHSLELAGVLEPAGLLQLADHGGLGVVTG